MSNYIDLDSFFRDRIDYPNENNFELTPQQVQTWFKSARAVKAYPSNPSLQPLEFATTVNVCTLVTPYTAQLASLPRIYLNFRSLKYDDQFLIYTIDGIHQEAKFILIIDRIQYSDINVPLWIHWKCPNMEQTMRFERSYPVLFKLTTRSGDILPQQDTIIPNTPNPFAQVMCTFQVTPYIRDGDYDNQMTDTFTG